GSSTERAALEAVRSGIAVPLETLLPDLEARTEGGSLIDAELIRVKGFLLYAVKVLTPAGRVQTEYYLARTGAHLEVR
ncbi:MAG TPA: hypothetical protein VGN79_12635, partial [Devosia sp.]|nr:hypothetical protein [Devosia sp.]